jgi:chromosome segregation ATPase
LEHLHEALGRIEGILTEERNRALMVREKVNREARENAAQVQTLSQKINEEKSKRKMLREELTTAAEHLRSSLERNTALLSALEATQQENGKATVARVKLEGELEKSRNLAFHLKEEVIGLKEELEAATISCASKTSMIDRLQSQVAHARAHASIQATPLSFLASSQRRLQARLAEIEKNKNQDVEKLQSDNDMLRLRLKEARAELALAQNEEAQEKARAGHDILLLASQRQVLSERLQQSQHTSALNAARVTELQGQVVALKTELKKAKAEMAAALADRSETCSAIEKACQVFEILEDRLQAAECREAAASMEAGRQRVALAAVGRGFEEIAEQLADAEKRLQSEKKSHRGTQAELNAARNESRVARRGKC